MKFKSTASMNQFIQKMDNKGLVKDTSKGENGLFIMYSAGSVCDMLVSVDVENETAMTGSCYTEINNWYPFFLETIELLKRYTEQ